jgi:hypothetical protein
MKKSFLILVCILSISVTTKSQYKINKTRYDYRSYKREAGDPYSPSLAGFASFLVPGIGQMYTGETRRGAFFLGSFAGCIIIYAIGSNSYYEQNGITYGGPVPLYIGLGGAIAVDILAIIDARHVAKVVNLALREQSKTGYNIRVSPFFGSSFSGRIPFGLSMKIRF